MEVFLTWFWPSFLRILCFLSAAHRCSRPSGCATSRPACGTHTVYKWSINVLGAETGLAHLPGVFVFEWNPFALVVVSACTVTLTLLQQGLIVYMWFNGRLFISPARSGVIHTAAARTFIGLEVMSRRKLLAEHPAAFTSDLKMP